MRLIILATLAVGVDTAALAAPAHYSLMLAGSPLGVLVVDQAIRCV